MDDDSDAFLQTLAANLAACMHERGMSEFALAEASGVAPRTVGNFLRPTNRRPSAGVPSGTLASLHRIAVALAVPPWQLLCDPAVVRTPGRYPREVLWHCIQLLQQVHKGMEKEEAFTPKHLEAVIEQQFRKVFLAMPREKPSVAKSKEEVEVANTKKRKKVIAVNFTDADDGSYIRSAQLIPHIVPFSSATLWRKAKEGTFPKPIKLGKAITAWRIGDVRAWLANPIPSKPKKKRKLQGSTDAN